MDIDCSCPPRGTFVPPPTLNRLSLPFGGRAKNEFDGAAGRNHRQRERTDRYSPIFLSADVASAGYAILSSRPKHQAKQCQRTGQVAPRGLPLGAPTDPDVQNSRIRLLKSQIRCSIHRADAPRLRERVALQQHAEHIPVHACSLRATLDPLAPRKLDLGPRAESEPWPGSFRSRRSTRSGHEASARGSSAGLAGRRDGAPCTTRRPA